MATTTIHNSVNGRVLRARDYTFNSFTVSNTAYVKVANETSLNRLDLKLQGKGDGTGILLLKFSEAQTDATALIINDAALVSDSLSSLLSNYSGDIFLKHGTASIDVVVYEAIK